MTNFRPCIDLHNGVVKQIVGGTLSYNTSELQENFVATLPASYYAKMYKQDQLRGGHVIQLGQGNEAVAKEALTSYPNALQIGGGINLDNAQYWLDLGASHVIVTSWLFEHEQFSLERLQKLSSLVTPERLVLDLSCRKIETGWNVATNRWQTVTKTAITLETLEQLAPYCAEFLIHAADVEGLCNGVDLELVALLSQWKGIPITYAGGISSIADITEFEKISDGILDFTVGSALDIFGGSGVSYEAMVLWNQRDR